MSASLIAVSAIVFSVKVINNIWTSPFLLLKWAQGYQSVLTSTLTKTLLPPSGQSWGHTSAYNFSMESFQSTNFLNWSLINQTTKSNNFLMTSILSSVLYKFYNTSFHYIWNLWLPFFVYLYLFIYFCMISFSIQLKLNSQHLLNDAGLPVKFCSWISNSKCFTITWWSLSSIISLVYSTLTSHTFKLLKVTCQQSGWMSLRLHLWLLQH